MTHTLSIMEARKQLTSLSETLEVMGDRKLMTQLRKSIAEMESGMLIPWQDAKREIGL